MKRILVIFLVVALLAGLAAGASIYFQVGPLATLVKLKEPVKPPPPPPPQHQQVDVSSFIVPVIQDHAVSRAVGLDIAVDILADDRQKVDALMPRLQNAFTLALYEIVPAHSDVHSAADKKAIHDRLLATAEHVYGKGVIQDVIIKSAYDR